MRTACTHACRRRHDPCAASSPDISNSSAARCRPGRHSRIASLDESLLRTAWTRSAAVVYCSSPPRRSGPAWPGRRRRGRPSRCTSSCRLPSRHDRHPGGRDHARAEPSLRPALRRRQPAGLQPCANSCADVGDARRARQPQLACGHRCGGEGFEGSDRRADGRGSCPHRHDAGHLQLRAAGGRGGQDGYVAAPALPVFAIRRCRPASIRWAPVRARWSVLRWSSIPRPRYRRRRSSRSPDSAGLSRSDRPGAGLPRHSGSRPFCTRAHDPARHPDSALRYLLPLRRSDPVAV